MLSSLLRQIPHRVRPIGVHDLHESVFLQLEKVNCQGPIIDLEFLPETRRRHRGERKKLDDLGVVFGSKSHGRKFYQPVHTSADLR
jgi:hypothetical protein